MQPFLESIMDMDDHSSSSSKQAWLWVIECLASFNVLDPSDIYDLVEASPISPEDFGTSTREMIAFRCLELYFGTDNEVANDVPSVTRPRRAFDFSESCEVVLDIITKVTPESAYPDASKWDIQPFIAHKRASRPKCTLEKLKVAILYGTHPYAASLAELGGLVRINDENDRITVDSVRHNELLQRIDGVGDGTRGRGENRFFTS